MAYFKHTFFVIIPMVIGSFKAHALKANVGLPLPMASSEGIFMTETRELLLTSGSIVLIGFILWVAYVVFCFPKNTLNKR